LTLPLAGALACALLVAGWLAEHNLSLRRELAQSTQEDDERQRVLASLQQEQKRTEAEIAAGARLSAKSPADRVLETSSDLLGKPIMRLSSGVSRGLATVPVLHLRSQASMVFIELELPFAPQGALHEELLNSDDKPIWSQQFSGSSSIAPNGVTTIVLPAALLATGEYRLTVEHGTNGGEAPGRATYLFRVRRD
jgi:hypothetical protein